MQSRVAEREEESWVEEEAHALAYTRSPPPGALLPRSESDLPKG